MFSFHFETLKSSSLIYRDLVSGISIFNVLTRNISRCLNIANFCNIPLLCHAGSDRSIYCFKRKNFLLDYLNCHTIKCQQLFLFRLHNYIEFETTSKMELERVNYSYQKLQQSTYTRKYIKSYFNTVM